MYNIINKHGQYFTELAGGTWTSLPNLRGYFLFSDAVARRAVVGGKVRACQTNR